MRSNRMSPWSRSGNLDVAELGLFNIAAYSNYRATYDIAPGPANATWTYSIIDCGAGGNARQRLSPLLTVHSGDRRGGYEGA